MSTTTDNLVILSELSTDLEAAMVIAALEREGIEAFMKGEFTAGFRAEAPSWPKVEVRESNLARAKEVLSAFDGLQVVKPNDDASASPRTTWQTICRTMILCGLIGILVLFIHSLAQTF